MKEKIETQDIKSKSAFQLTLIIDHLLGNFGWYIAFICLIPSLVKINSGMNATISVFVVPKIDFRCRTCFETIEDLNYTTYEHGIEQYFYPKIKDKCGYHIDKCNVSDTVLLSSESNPDTFQTLPSELVECCYPDQYNDVVNILSGNPDALEQCSALITEFEGKNATDPSAIPEVYQNYVPCDSKSYIFSKDRFETTATEDFSLVCGRSWLLDLTGSIYYLGFGIGGITTGWIADVYGRKYITIFCIACSIVADIVTGYVNTTELFLLMRFVNGFFTNGMMVPAFTLCMEFIGSKYRAHMANWYSGLFSLGIMLLSYPYALIFNEWRPFYQWISISAIPPLVMMFFVPESYKWLMSQGRTEDAFEIAETIMQKNNKSYAHEKNPEKSERLHQVVEEISYRATQAKKGSLADVFKSKNLRGVTLNLCLAWFTSSTVYYGLGLNAGNLPGSDIFNNFMSGLFEIPAYILFPIIVNIKKLGRVRSLAWAYILGGLCCGISTLCLEMQKCDDPDLLPEQQDHTMSTLGQVFAFVGKFFYAGCFSSCYTYSSEIYPSSVRSNGVGLTSAAARVGGILTPFILGLDSVASWLPGSIYAVLGVVTGICAFWLPETLGKPLLSTVEQTEKVYFSDTEQK